MGHISRLSWDRNKTGPSHNPRPIISQARHLQNYLFSISFTTIKEQVDAGQPFKIGLSPDARAGYGYDSRVSPIRIYFSDPGTGTKSYNLFKHTIII
jgi:hypothetical protein